MQQLLSVLFLTLICISRVHTQIIHECNFDNATGTNHCFVQSVTVTGSTGTLGTQPLLGAFSDVTSSLKPTANGEVCKLPYKVGTFTWDMYFCNRGYCPTESSSNSSCQNGKYGNILLFNNDKRPFQLKTPSSGINGVNQQCLIYYYYLSSVAPTTITVRKEEANGATETLDVITSAPFNGWIQRKVSYNAAAVGYKIYFDVQRTNGTGLPNVGLDEISISQNSCDGQSVITSTTTTAAPSTTTTITPEIPTTTTPEATTTTTPEIPTTTTSMLEMTTTTTSTVTDTTTQTLLTSTTVTTEIVVPTSTTIQPTTTTSVSSTSIITTIITIDTTTTVVTPTTYSTTTTTQLVTLTTQTTSTVTTTTTGTPMIAVTTTTDTPLSTTTSQEIVTSMETSTTVTYPITFTTSSVTTTSTSTTTTAKVIENIIVASYNKIIPHEKYQIIIMATVIPVVWVAFIVALIWMKKTSGVLNGILHPFSNWSSGNENSSGYELGNVSTA